MYVCPGNASRAAASVGVIGEIGGRVGDEDRDLF